MRMIQIRRDLVDKYFKARKDYYDGLALWLDDKLSSKEHHEQSIAHRRAQDILHRALQEEVELQDAAGTEATPSAE